MSDIRFLCPYCAQSIDAPEDMRGRTVDCPACGKPFQVPALASPPHPGRQPGEEVQTNVKQGALIGAATCFVVGLLFMTWSLLTFVIYGPLFLAAFVLSIVALAQKRIIGGLLMLLATIIIPPIIGLVLAATRVTTAAQTINQALEEAAADSQREALKIIPKPIDFSTAAKERAPRVLHGLPVSGARYFREETFLAHPHIQFSVQNQTGTAISRIFCRGCLTSPGRTVPWADQEFNVSIPGGLEPGETKEINLRPPQNGPYGHDALKNRTDLVMEITVLNAVDASGQRLVR